MKSKFLPFLLLLAVLPVLIFRDYTPSNELRYLSIVDEALRNGDIFTFTNHGIQYADKPPLYFWILMLGKWLLGNMPCGLLHSSLLFPGFSDHVGNGPVGGT